MKNSLIAILIFSSLVLPGQGAAAFLERIDSDDDKLSDQDESAIYRTNPLNSDTDGDGFSDGDEINSGFDPNKYFNDKLEKTIWINLKTQTLSYALGGYRLKEIKISTGLKRTPTPAGEFKILKKVPKVTYKGAGYFFPNTKWNLQFKAQKIGNLYIHGAYWHNNFGRPMSHGCVNVSYKDMEPLYLWADKGASVFIQ